MTGIRGTVVAPWVNMHLGAGNARAPRLTPPVARHGMAPLWPAGHGRQGQHDHVLEGSGEEAGVPLHPPRCTALRLQHRADPAGRDRDGDRRRARRRSGRVDRRGRRRARHDQSVHRRAHRPSGPRSRFLVPSTPSPRSSPATSTTRSGPAARWRATSWASATTTPRSGRGTSRGFPSSARSRAMPPSSISPPSRRSGSAFSTSTSTCRHEGVLDRILPHMAQGSRILVDDVRPRRSMGTARIRRSWRWSRAPA